MSRRLVLSVGLVCLFAVALGAAAPALGQAVAPKTSVHIDGEYGPFGITNVSAHGHRIDQLINVVHGFMAALFVGWGVFFVYCLVRYRQRPGHTADYALVKAKPSKYVEVAVMVFEAVLLLGFAIPIWASVKNDIPTADKNPLRIRVVAEQFAWNFHYPGADGKFGKTNPKLVDTATNPLGLDRASEGAADDVFAMELHVPVNRPMICDISSKDVIHSFFLPVMRVKQDAIPGMRIPVWFEANKTGVYEVACAQLCGNNHYSMRALMYIQDAKDFDKWMAEKSKPAEEFKD